MANFVRPFEIWVAEGVASEVNDFNPDCIQYTLIRNVRLFRDCDTFLQNAIVFTV